VTVRVLGPDGKPRAGVQITLTNTATNRGALVRHRCRRQLCFRQQPGDFPRHRGRARLGDRQAGSAADPERSVLRADDRAEGRRGADTPRTPASSTTSPSSATKSRRWDCRASVPAPRRCRRQPCAPMPSLLHAGSSAPRWSGSRSAVTIFSGCLQNPFDNALRLTAASQGLGGISLGLCEALAIVDNDIERNGVSGAQSRLRHLRRLRRGRGDRAQPPGR
jgi:hypothetical protein